MLVKGIKIRTKYKEYITKKNRNIVTWRDSRHKSSWIKIKIGDKKVGFGHLDFTASVNCVEEPAIHNIIIGYTKCCWQAKADGRSQIWMVPGRRNSDNEKFVENMNFFSVEDIYSTQIISVPLDHEDKPVYIRTPECSAEKWRLIKKHYSKHSRTKNYKPEKYLLMEAHPERNILTSKYY